MKSRNLYMLMLSAGLGCAEFAWAKTADEFLRDAQNYQQQGKSQEALIQLKNALKEDPKQLEARLLLGQLYFDEGQLIDAEKELQRAKELGAERSKWMRPLVLSLLGLNKADQALVLLTPEAEDSSLFKAEMLALRGRAYIQQKQKDEARQAFLEALSLNPELTEALLGQARLAVQDREPLKALELADRILKQDSSAIEAWLLKGDLLTTLRRYPEAIDAFDQTIKVNPKLIRPYIGRAEIHLEMNQLDKAAQDIQVLKDLVKSGPMISYLDAKMAFLQGDNKTALKLTNEILQREPKFFSAYMLIGRIQFAEKNFLAAKEAFEKFNYEMKDPPETLRLLALTQIRLGEIDKAVLLLRQLERKYPNDASLKALLGSALIQLKRADEGMAFLQKSIELAPNIGEYRTQLAMALLQSGSADGAVNELEQALKAQPDLIQADILLVTTHLKNKEYAKAKKAAQEFVERSKQKAVAHNLLGMVLMEQGDNEGARKEFSRSVQEDPKFLASRLNLSRLAVKENQYDEAEQILRDLLAVNKSYIPAIQGMTILLGRKQQPKLLEDWLKKSWAENRDEESLGTQLFQYYMSLGKYQDAQGVASELEQYHPDSAAAYRALGIAYMAAGSTNNALRNFNKLVNLMPEQPEFYLLLAAAKVAAKDPDGAMATYQQVIRLKPDFLQAWEGLVALEFKQGQKEQAFKRIRELQQKYPQAPLGYELEGRYWLAEKKLSDALKMYEKSHQLVPRPENTLVLSNLYAAHGRRAEAEKVLEQWLQKDPDNSSIGFALASAWQSQGKTKEALARYKQVYAKDPKHLNNLNNLVWLAWTEQDPQLKQYLQALQALKPDSALVLDTLGWVLLQTGDLAQGSKILADAYAKDSKQPDLRYHYAVSLAKQGDKAKAKQILQALLAEGVKFEGQADAQKLLSTL